MARDSGRSQALDKILQRRRTAAVVPSSIINDITEAHQATIQELGAQKEYVVFLSSNEKVANREYKLSTARKSITSLKDACVKLHFALVEANMISDYLEGKSGAPEELAEAQQRLCDLAEVASDLAPEDGEQIEEEPGKSGASETRTSSSSNVDLSLVTRLAGSGIRVGPMHFRMIAGQLERTYMNMVRITTDKEDTKKFVRGVKKFFLPPGRTLESVGITEKWLKARGFGDKEAEDLLS